MTFRAGKEAEKDKDWVRLADIIGKAARNHKSYTPEIADLCEDMRNGTLKGYLTFFFNYSLL